jgi:hypothetical protein
MKVSVRHSFAPSSPRLIVEDAEIGGTYEVLTGALFPVARNGRRFMLRWT